MKKITLQQIRKELAQSDAESITDFSDIFLDGYIGYNQMTDLEVLENYLSWQYPLDQGDSERILVLTVLTDKNELYAHVYQHNAKTEIVYENEI